MQQYLFLMGIYHMVDVELYISDKIEIDGFTTYTSWFINNNFLHINEVKE